MTSEAPLSVGVIIATKGRRECIPHLIDSLGRQTVLPKIVVISTVEKADLPEDIASLCEKSALDFQILFGPAGSACQRNLGKRLVHGKTDIILFIDDDFLLAPSWIERCARIFASDSKLVGLTGELAADGAICGGLNWEQAEEILQAALRQPEPAEKRSPVPDTYGCNMAFRATAAEDIWLDEQMGQYAWMEDRDFSIRVGRKGKLLKSSILHGVHLGIRSARTSGVKLGYSQVVNPFYLWRKGTLTFNQAALSILRPLLMNTLKSLRPEEYIDRRGRLKGNVLALRDIATGCAKPERVSKF